MKTILFFFALVVLGLGTAVAQEIPCNDVAQLTAKLKAIRDTDQNSRQALIQQMKIPDPVKMRQLSQQMLASDKANQAFVGSLLDKCGWPQGLASLENNTLFLVIDHADTAFMSRYFPLLQQQADKGVVQKSDLATLQDRMLMRKGLKQLYGTQTFKNAQTQVMTVWPVEDATHLTERRQAMGLLPMDTYIQLVKNTYHNEITWDQTLTVAEAQKAMWKQ